MSNIIDFVEYRKWNRKCDACKVREHRIVDLETDIAHCDMCMSKKDREFISSLLQAKNQVLRGETK